MFGGGLVRAAALALFALSSGCGGAFETVSELPKVPRRPDGVVLDRPLTLPDPVERGEVGGGMLALREPFDARGLVELVRAYFRAWEREDFEAFSRMLTPDAVILGRVGAPLDAFRTRVRTYEYQHIAGLEPARFEELERMRRGELEGGARPPEMRDDDLLVRVPVLVGRVGGEPLFGDRLVLLLRREEGSLRIAGIAEENGTR